jgi:hypothetical protein
MLIAFIILSLIRLRQKDHIFKVSLGLKGTKKGGYGREGRGRQAGDTAQWYSTCLAGKALDLIPNNTHTHTK